MSGTTATFQEWLDIVRGEKLIHNKMWWCSFRQFLELMKWEKESRAEQKKDACDIHWEKTMLAEDSRIKITDPKWEILDTKNVE